MEEDDNTKVEATTTFPVGDADLAALASTFYGA